MLGAFCAGLDLAAQVLVILVSADATGWRMAARSRQGPPATRLVCPWLETLPGCWADWMAPFPAPGVVGWRSGAQDPSPRLGRRRGCAGGAPGRAALGAHHLVPQPLLRGSPRLSALQHGDFRRPAVQDAALLLGAACLDLGLLAPHFLPRAAHRAPAAPDSYSVAPDVDWDASSPALRVFLKELADVAGAHISLDVFASASSSLAARYFSASQDLRAEGIEAFAQPD
jgi:hypothetical protein